MAEKLYKKFDPNFDFSSVDHIIIGSGIGALVTGVFLSKAGKKVAILERHYVPGGYSHTFKRKDGFEWDVGIHYVGRMDKGGMFHKMSDYLSGGRTEWNDMGEVYDVATWNGEEFKFRTGEEEFRKQMYEYFPDNKQDIDKYLKVVKKAAKRSTFNIVQKALPPVLRFMLGGIIRRRFRKYSRQTTYDALKKITKNEKLQNVLCAQCGDYGLPPKQSSFAIHCVVVNHFMEGGYYPVGGAGKICGNMVNEIVDHGGTVFVRSDVEEIRVENKQVKGITVNGKFIPHNSVISGIGAPNTYGKLIDRSNLSEKLMAFEKVKPSHAHFCLYLGMDKTDEELNLPKHNIWYYQGDDMETVLDELLSDKDKDIHFAYISFPSAKDTAWVRDHGQTSTIQAIGLSNYEWFEKFEGTDWMKRGEEYDKLKKDWETKMLEKLYEIIPQIKGHVVAAEVSTPLSTKHFTNHGRGEIYGLSHTPERYDLNCLDPNPPIKGLYMTGQDITTCGYGGAMASGLVCATHILKYKMYGEFKKLMANEKAPEGA